MTAPGFRGGLLRGGIFGLWGEQVQGEFLREGLWGEQVQGEGRRSRRAKPGPRGSAAGSAPLRGARLRRRFLRFAGVCEGTGPGRGGPGARVWQGLAEGQGWGGSHGARRAPGRAKPGSPTGAATAPSRTRRRPARKPRA